MLTARELIGKLLDAYERTGLKPCRGSFHKPCTGECCGTSALYLADHPEYDVSRDNSFRYDNARGYLNKVAGSSNDLGEWAFVGGWDSGPNEENPWSPVKHEDAHQLWDLGRECARALMGPEEGNSDG